jgi:hypothetical protein
MEKLNDRHFLNENEVRGRTDRQQGMPHTYLMAYVLDQCRNHLTNPIPAEDMIGIRELTFLKIVNCAEKLDREMKMRAQGSAEAAAEEVRREKVKTTDVRG